MDKTEALRSIHYDLLEYIQRKVKVDFDYARQRPVSFTLGGRKHVVGEVVGRFKTRKEYPVNAFLVRANSDEVFFLYFHYYGFDPHRSLHAGNWVLSFRILNDNELMAFYREDRKMLINMTLKRVVDLSLKRQWYGDEDEYNRLEYRILNNEATFDEVTQFQSFLDGRVKHLLSLPPEGLFKVEPYREPAQYHAEIASIYLTCTCCGEQVLKSHINDYRGQIYCIPCFQRMNIGAYRGLQ